MKCIFLLIIATVLGTPALASEVVHGSIPSPQLGRAMNYQLYLPDGYGDGISRFEIVYLLHGAAGNERTWMKLGRIKATVDRLIASKAIPPVIVAMPGCRRCWWVDGRKDKAETALWNDFVPSIERRFRTTAGNEGRFFAGLSAGGHAVVRYSLKYPDRIKAAAALSPAIYAQAPPSFSAARRNPPFLDERGRFDLNVWHSRNYPNFVASYIAQPTRVPLYLMAGRQDRFGTAAEARRLYNRIHRHQPSDIKLRVVDGRHTWRLWSSAISDALIYMLNRRQTGSVVDW